MSLRGSVLFLFGRDGERVGVVGECAWRTGAAAWGRADGIQDGECQAERAEDPLAVST